MYERHCETREIEIWIRGGHTALCAINAEERSLFRLEVRFRGNVQHVRETSYSSPTCWQFPPFWEERSILLDPITNRTPDGDVVPARGLIDLISRAFHFWRVLPCNVTLNITGLAPWFSRKVARGSANTHARTHVCVNRAIHDCAHPSRSVVFTMFLFLSLLSCLKEINGVFLQNDWLSKHQGQIFSESLNLDFTLLKRVNIALLKQVLSLS